MDDVTMIPCHSSRWDEIVCAMPGFDIYHTSEFHQLKKGGNIIESSLFYYRSGEHAIALPLVLRSIDGPCGQSRRCIDASSVYGYPGPLANSDALPAAVIAGFQGSLATMLRQLGVISVFSRLNPFKPNKHLVEGLGKIEEAGYNVGIDLTLKDDARFAAYRHNHRDNIRRLRTAGMRVVHDHTFAHINEFKTIYHDNLRRRGAYDWYYFDARYFDRIVRWITDRSYLLIGKVGDETVCGGLFLCINGVAHAHLTATSSSWLPRAPVKMLFDEAAHFFRERGYRVLHLGGGLGGKADSLLHFKIGFGTLSFPFMVWKWIVDHERYQGLCALQRDRCSADDQDYFPGYRRREDRI